MFEIFKAGGTGVTLVPVPTKTARSHNDIKGRRPFDVPASIYHVLEWRPAKPSTGMSFSYPFETKLLLTLSDGTVVLSCIRTRRTSGKDVERNTSLRFLTSNLPNMPVSFN